MNKGSLDTKKKGLIGLGALVVLAGATILGSDPLYKAIDDMARPAIYTAGTYTAVSYTHRDVYKRQGVASVIILVSLVNGQMSYMTESFASMGTNQITVNVTNLSTRSVSVDEMYEFYEDNRDLFAQMTPNVTVSTTVKNGTESSTSTTVSGVSEEYLEMKDMELESGRFIQYSDIVSRQKVCVVGYYVAWDLYGGVEKAIDQTIKIGGNAFRIIGVAARQDDDELESGGSDDFVWMPYSCAAKMTRNANISSYT